MSRHAMMITEVKMNVSCQAREAASIVCIDVFPGPAMSDKRMKRRQRPRVGSGPDAMVYIVVVLVATRFVT